MQEGARNRSKSDFAANRLRPWDTSLLNGDDAYVPHFNFNWSRRILTQNQTLLLITDGLERDDSQNLDFEITRLSLFTNKILWLNPLLRYEKFEPKVNSIKTILRHVDKHIPIHNLNSIKNLVENIF